MFENVLILAGGQGDRLWPMSTNDNPKQFIKFFEKKSLFALTVRRVLNLGIKGKLLIITRTNWVNTVCDEINAVLEENEAEIFSEKIVVIGEPFGRNTAPAVTLACKLIPENESLLMLPSDHIILDKDKFKRDMETASELSKSGFVVTFGIKPTRPETGFGYIECGTEIARNKAYMINSFKEKPDKTRALEYQNNGKYLWNSGIYAFMAKTYLNELSLYQPDMYEYFDGIGEVKTSHENGYNIINKNSQIESVYSKCANISIDKAISEKTKLGATVLADFNWDDAGTWDALSAYKEIDSKNKIQVDAMNNFVFSDMSVAICGLEDIIVVANEGNILVMKKGYGNEVKNIPQLVQNENRN